MIHLIFYFLILINTCDSSSMVDPDGCDSLLVDFATSAADFMLCAVSNARPIRMCSSCIGSYNGVITNHGRILQISEITNKTCRDRLINLDRLEIIEAGYTYVTNLWEKGRCQNCFDSRSPSASEPSNETLQFQLLWKETSDCFDENYDTENDKYDNDVCYNCSSPYWKTNYYYDELKRKFGDGHLCMDIVDAMNISQNLWSETLECENGKLPPELPLLAACSIALTLPILFYLLVLKFSQVVPAPVSQQKRLSERFVERFRSRTGSFISQFRNRDMQQSFSNEPTIS